MDFYLFFKMYYFDKTKIKETFRKENTIVGDTFIDVVTFELDLERRERN